MNSRDEIKDIAPKLSQWRQEEGYRVPDGYFGSIADTVVNRVRESKELKPYFNSLPDEVMSKIKQEEKGNKVSIKRYYKYAIAAILLLTIGTMVWSSIEEESISPTYATVLEDSEELDFVIDDLSLEDIFDSDFIDEDTFDEILANEDELDESVEDIFSEVDDDLLEEFIDAI